MENSRKSRSSDAAAGLPGRVADDISPFVSPGSTLLLGLSGGVDSVSLLSVLAGIAGPMRFSLRAVHVNHGISPNAGSWAQFCAELCDSMQVPLAVEAVDVAAFRELGREGAARAARYEAFARHAADFLVLAHHRDDQAETLLVQLLRGAGLPGLSGMPHARVGPERTLLRPFLGVARGDIESFARDRKLRWIEDESNSDTALDRNHLRLRVMPQLEERFPGAAARIARSAGHIAESAALLDELGRMDLDGADTGDGLDIGVLRELGAPRAKNALRALCRLSGCPAPPAAALEELWRQLVSAREAAQPRADIGRWAFLRYRGRLYLEKPAHAPGDFSAAWEGEASLLLVELGGVLRFKPEEGRGLSVSRLRSAPVSIRLRRGGERLRPGEGRPSRTLKNLMQERGVPPWRRAALPLVYCGETLVSVPGVGNEAGWQAARGERGMIVSWETG
jgi:tRNA(Ile)-lysidine synthase